MFLKQLGMNRFIKKKIVILSLLLPLALYGLGFDKNYQKISDTKKMKDAFISVMLPKIYQVNYKIAKERHFIEKFFNKKLFLNSSHSRQTIKQLTHLAEKYMIADIYNKQEFLKKINYIPVSLVLAQGALESAWGKSRFVQVANNIFGQWTYGEKGIIPKNRAEGKHHKIRIFQSINDSIEAYMLNLNRNKAYEQFRNERYENTCKKEIYTGYAAADTMQNYSGIGYEYNAILKQMIEKNNFGQFDYKTVQKEF
jgi:Bax protein